MTGWASYEQTPGVYMFELVSKPELHCVVYRNSYRFIGQGSAAPNLEYESNAASNLLTLTVSSYSPFILRSHKGMDLQQQTLFMFSSLAELYHWTPYYPASSLHEHDVSTAP